MTRRAILSGAGLGLLGTAVGLAGGIYLGRSRILSDVMLLSRPLPKVEGVIDTHHHFLPPFFVEALGQEIQSVTPNGHVPGWTPSLDLETLDASTIRKAVMSAPFIVPGATQAAKNALARRLNEFGADLMRDHPSRYGHFATMPMPDADASLVEAAYALDTLKASGLILFTNYDGTYLGDARFEPLWQELDRRRAVVFVHPTRPPYVVGQIPDGILEFTFDTTRTVTSLIYGGVTQRHPGIKFIFSHGGGTVPFIASRIDGGTRLDPKLSRQLPNGVLPELRKLYWDTALCFDEGALKSLLTIADPSHVMYGTDVPFAPDIVIPVSLKSLGKNLPPDVLETVLSGSAARIIPGLNRNLPS